MSDGFKSEASIGTSLLVRVRELEPDAWGRLVRIYGPVVFRWCLRAGLRSEDASDIGQEVFRAVADSIANFRRDRTGDTFVGWLRTITRYKIADYRRRQSVDPEAIGGTDFQIVVSQLSDGDNGEEAEQEESPDKVNSVLFHRALEILQSEFEPRTWKAFWGTAVEGRATKDVAADLEMSDMAVRKAKSRVLRRLRDEFDENMIE